MKLAVSNIAWTASDDAAMLPYLAGHGITGLEIAPTRIFPDDPYDHAGEARAWAKRLARDHHLSVASMQSIWYGRQEALFGTDADRAALLAYTKKAIAFAAATGCTNLVFGCPRNRVRQGRDDAPVRAFFRDVAAAAASAGVVFALEANPPIYHTDYLNTTKDVLSLADELDVPGLGVNLDLGTMVENGETADILRGRVRRIHHVHLSEPYLRTIEHRGLHQEIATILKDEDYDGFVSLEMGKDAGLDAVRASIRYLGEVFGA